MGDYDNENGDRRRHRDDDYGRDRDSSRKYRDDDRGRDRDPPRRSRDDDRHRRRDDRDGGDRDREYSRGDDRERRRDRSRSRSPGGRKSSSRKSGFDLAPPGSAVVQAPSGVQVPFSGVPQPMPGMYAGVPMPGMLAGFGAMPVSMPSQAMMAGQATRHARRVYVGGLPPLANEQTVAVFFSRAMTLVEGATAGPGDCVIHVYMNHEKKFAFVEFRTAEEASNAMALDGINFEGVSVRVRRPSDYNPSLASALGPSQPSPNLNLAAVGLAPGGAGGADGPDRIFIGGLPYYLTEDQIKELLQSFGPLRGFDLVKDRDTGNSKGYGFAVYQDANVTDIACAALNGMKMGDKTLTVRRATASGQPKPDQINMIAVAQQQLGMHSPNSSLLLLQKLAAAASGANNVPLGGIPGLEGLAALGPGETPSKVISLSNCVTPTDLADDQDYEDIKVDMQEECSKFGQLVSIIIPRPRPGEEVPGVGKVFVEYTDSSGAMSAKQALNGRKFGGNPVVALFFSEELFAKGEYS